MGCCKEGERQGGRGKERVEQGRVKERVERGGGGTDPPLKKERGKE
jgi:hypothetical protein